MLHYVYIIRSVKFPHIIYVGHTINIKARLATHNSGGSIHTRKDRPWELLVCITFKDESCARRFEKYLKTHSGRIFLKKRLIPE